MHTYRNEQHRFDIGIPEEWSYHSSGKDGSLIFKCRDNEAFHIEIVRLLSQPTCGQSEDKLKREVEKKGYTSLATGRIKAGGKEHAWARYYLGGGLWLKKYLLDFDETEYAITATCLEEKLLLEMEKKWDAVILSFHPTKFEQGDTKAKIAPIGSTEVKNAEKQLPSTSKPEGMKTYRNDVLGFEIDVPEPWLLPKNDFVSTPSGAEVIFNCGGNEAFYMVLWPAPIKLSPDQIRFEFHQYALAKGYSRLEFGKLPVSVREFVSVRYYLGNNIWIKKYLLYADPVCYEITGSCTEQGGQPENFNQRGVVWDAIVRSLKIMRSPAGIPQPSLPGWIARPATEVPPKFEKGEEAAKPTGSKTYRNEKHGFEIDIPETWQPAPSLAYGLTKIFAGPEARRTGKDVFQYGNSDEAFNFEIGPLFPEPSLEDTEDEFSLYARNRGFMDLRFGRIMAAGKEHVCACYFIQDKMGRRWNKKYMVVIGGIEYALTGTCNDPQFFTTREKAWDVIVQTFRPLKPFDDTLNTSNQADRYREARHEIVQERMRMRATLGELYGQAYEAVSLGEYKQARKLLEQCLQENPDHVLAHKELAVVLEKLGDIKGAIHHRTEVRRLAPDDVVNRTKLDELLAQSGKRTQALKDVQEMLKRTPGHPVYRDLEKKLRQPGNTNYRMLFFSSLICLLLVDISFYFPEYVAIRNVWCISLMMILPAWGTWISGPWVGIPRRISGLIAGALYLFFLIKAW